jgi:hypothetical protein
MQLRHKRQTYCHILELGDELDRVDKLKEPHES